MNLHKKFISLLGEKRKSTVGDIVCELEIVDIKNKSILNANANLNELEEIFYTVNFLKENDFVEELSNKNNPPTFDPKDFIETKGENLYVYKRVHAIPDYLEKYWGLELLVNPSYFKMMENGYKTDEEKEKSVQFRKTVLIAILSATSSAFFTSWFTSVDLTKLF